MTEIRIVPIDDLKDHPLRENFSWASDDLAGLAYDIQTCGLRNRPTVTPELEIIAGHRRIRAAKLLGWSHIEVFIDRSPPEIQKRLFYSSNTTPNNFGLKDRLTAYRLEAPDILRSDRLSAERLAEVAEITGIAARRIRRDLTRVRKEKMQRLGITDLRESWEGKLRQEVRINVVEAGNRLFLVQVRARNFRAESGPAPLHEALEDSYKQSKVRKAKAPAGRHPEGAELRRLREELGVSQNRMAPLLGYRQSTLCEFEAGKWNPHEALQRMRRLRANWRETGKLEPLPDRPSSKKTRDRPRATRSGPLRKQPLAAAV